MPRSSKQRALTLAKKGLRVFPIAAGKKKPPLLREWEKRASSDPAEVEPWWAKHPDANIGVHCADLLVLDVDAQKGGLTSLKAVLAEQGPLPKTFEVNTPSGGRHLYYRCEGGVRNRVDLWPGVDVRSTNGYVLAPGSTAEGRPYTVRTRSQIVNAPEWLVEAAAQTAERDPNEKTPDDVDPDVACARARQWLDKAPPAVEGRGGDHHTFRIVCKVRDFGVPEDKAIDVLFSWNLRCEPPWDPSELEQKIHNAYRYAQNPPALDSVEAMFDKVEGAAEAHTRAEAPARGSDSDLYGPDDVRLSELLETNYLVKNWLDRETHAMLFGPWGAGKTFMALDLAAHLSAGRDWFDARVKPAGTLYLGYEGARAMRRRLYALRQEYPDWDMRRFRVLSMRWPLGVRDATGKGHAALTTALAAYLEAQGAYPSLVVVDPLRNALGGSDSDPELTAPYLAYMQRLMDKIGCTVLTVHHPGHGEGERGRGDSAIEAHMDTVLRMDDARGSIEATKQRDAAKREAFYRLKIVGLGKDPDGDDLTTCVVQPVDRNPMDPALTDAQTRILQHLKELVGADGAVSKGLFNSVSSELSKAAQAEAWALLVQKGYLVKDGKQWRFGAGAAEMFEDLRTDGD